VKADSQELVITNVVGSNLKKYQAPANVNSGIFGTLNITSNRIIDSHQVTISYLSETEIEFKLSYIDTETSQSIVVAQFVIKNESKNYFSNKVNIKLYTNREVHINDVEIVPQTKGEIKNYFADWSKIDENGKIENNQIVKYIGSVEDNKYISRVNFKVTTSNLRTNNNNHMKIIYDYKDDANYNYLAYRFTNSGTVYAALGKCVDGTFLAGTDSAVSGTKSIRLHEINLGAVNENISIVKANTADDYYLTVDYTGTTTLDIIFTNGTERDKEVCISVKSAESDICFTSGSEHFALLTTADVVLSGAEGIDVPKIEFDDAIELCTKEKFISDFLDLIYMDISNVKLEHKGKIENALEVYAKSCSQSVQKSLVEEKTKLEKLLQRVAEISLQEQLGIQRPSIADEFYDDFENADKSTKIWRNAGRFGLGKTETAMTVVEDKNNPSNHYMLLNGANAFIEPYFFVQPEKASMKKVSYDVVEFSKLTDEDKTMKWQLVVGYIDENNYSYFHLEYVRRVDQFRVVPKIVINGNSLYVGGWTYLETQDLSKGFHVDLSYDEVALRVQMTITPKDDKDGQVSFVNQYTHPAAAIAFSMNEQKCRIGVDNVRISYVNGDWDTDDPILNTCVLYSENTKVSPGDVTLISGPNLGKLVKEIQIMELPKETTQMGYVLQDLYDQKATKAEYTNPIEPETMFRSSEAINADIVQVTENAVKFEIPAVLNDGVYLIKIKSKYESQDDVYHYINRPTIDFTVGDEGKIVTAGGTIRVIGKHLAHYFKNDSADINDEQGINQLGVKASLKSASGEESCKVTAVQSRYSLAVDIPKNIKAGTYELSVYNGSGGNGAWSEPIKIQVGASPRADRPTEIFDVTDFGADPSADSADTPAFISALDAAAKNGGGIVYVPQGIYTIGYTLHIPKNVHLMGDGISKTTVMFSSARYDYGQLPETVFAVQGDFEISKMSIEANRCKSIFYSPVRCDNIYVHDVRTQVTPQRGRETSGGGGQPLITPAEAIALRQSEQGKDYAFNFYYDVRFNNSDLYSNIQIKDSEILYFTNLRISASYTQIQNVKFENKRGEGASSYSMSCDGDFSLVENCTRGAGQFMGVTEGNRIYCDGNEFGGVIYNNSEIQTTDGGPKIGSDRDGVMQEVKGSEGLTFKLLTGKSYPKNELKGMTLAVLEGQGAMQMRTIVSSEGNLLTIDKPFVISPNRNSRIMVSRGRADLIFVNNKYSVGGVVGSYGPLRGVVFDNNDFSDSLGSLLRTHYDGTNWYNSIVDSNYRDANFIHVYGEGTNDNSRVGGILLDSSNSRMNGLVSIVVRGCNFYDGSHIKMTPSTVEGNVKDIIFDKCNFYDADQALILPYSEKQIIDGILLNRISLTNVVTDVRISDSEKQDLYQNSLNEYDSKRLLICDISEAEALRGDVNQDGIVDELDVSIIQLYLCSKIGFTPSMKRNANLDNNDIVDIKDALLLKLLVK